MKIHGKHISTFVEAYLEAMFWTEGSHDGEGELGNPDLTFFSLAPETLDRVISDCDRFYERAHQLLSGESPSDNLDPAQCGHDFWLTRNRHGVGFWDRGLGKRGDALADIAHEFGETWVYVGDDGQVYLSGGK